MYLFVESVTVTFIDTTSMADRKAGCCARMRSGMARAVARKRKSSGLCFMVVPQVAAVKGRV